MRKYETLPSGMCTIYNSMYIPRSGSLSCKYQLSRDQEGIYSGIFHYSISNKKHCSQKATNIRKVTNFSACASRTCRPIRLGRSSLGLAPETVSNSMCLTTLH